MVSYRKEGENVFIKMNVHGQEMEVALNDNQKANIRADITKVFEDINHNNDIIVANEKQIEELDVQINDLNEDIAAAADSNEESMSKINVYASAFDEEIQALMPVDEEETEE